MMYPVFFSMWIAMWAVLLVTLPFHLLLHGLVAYRIAQVEGWGAVFRRGRYLREIRQSRTLSRMMLGWLVIAFLEVCALVGLSGLVAYTAQSYEPEAIQIVSVPQSGDVLLVTFNTLWRVDAETFTPERSVVFPNGQTIRGMALAPDGNLLYLDINGGSGARATDDLQDTLQFDFASAELTSIPNNKSASILAVSPDSRHAIANYEREAPSGIYQVCILTMETGECKDLPTLPEDTRVWWLYWLPDGSIMGLMRSSRDSLVSLNLDEWEWKTLTEVTDELIYAAAYIPGENALIIHGTSYLEIYDIDSNRFQPAPNIVNSTHPVSLVASPDGARLLLLPADDLIVYDLASGELLYQRATIANATWLSDSLHVLVVGYPASRVVSRIMWFSELTSPIKRVQQNIPYVLLEIINILTGEVVASFELPESPTMIQVVN